MIRVILPLLLLVANTATAADLTVDGANSPYSISIDETWDNVSVLAGGTLVINATLNAIDVTVASGGTITHDVNQTGIHIAASGTVTVSLGGTITATSKGLRGGNNGSGFGGRGAAYDSNAGQLVAGSDLGNGGSYGGSGGVSRGGRALNPTYGTRSALPRVGAGGGAGGCSGLGGHGGGLIVVDAAAMVVNGSVLANGGASGPYRCSESPGGGSGGGIFLTLGTLSGVGTIAARGGNGAGGGGGGGRLSALYDSHTYTGSLGTLGGTGSPWGGVGTAWLISRTDDLYVAGGKAPLDGGDAISSISFGAAGILVLNGPATNAAGPLIVTEPGQVNVNDSSALAGVPIDPTISGTLVLNVAHTFLNPIRINSTSTVHVRQPLQLPALDVAGTLVLNARMDVTNDVNFLFGSITTHDTNNANFDMRAGGDITIDGGASIAAAGKGLGGGNNGSGHGDRGATYNPNTFEVVSGSALGASGAHGAAGAGTGAAAAYGDAGQPTRLGGGGGGGGCSGYGGRGGGRFRFEAVVVQVDGSINADAANSGPYRCNPSPGGGAGGSVWIVADTFAGSGSITARGGGGAGPAGAGGRIAADYVTKTYTGFTSARGGSYGWGAAKGTVQMLSAANDIVVEDGNLTGVTGDTFESVTLSNGGKLILDGSTTITAPLAIPLGATLVINSTTALDNITLLPNIGGTLVVNEIFDIPIALTVTGNITVNEVTTAQSLDIFGHLAINAELDVTGDVTLRTGASMGHNTNDPDFVLNVTGAVTLETDSNINVSGAGLGAGNNGGTGATGWTVNPSTSLVVAGSTEGNGGSHGGAGDLSGTGAVGPVYGDRDGPIFLGGGGGAGGCSGYGGRGGGRVRISAGTLNHRGSIQANGAGGGPRRCGRTPGGGAGGSIWLSTTALSGTGLIRANGGGGSGGGGGGRILVTYETGSYDGLMEARGGSTGGAAGAIGSAVLSGSAGELVISGGTEELFGGETLTSLELVQGATLTLSGPVTIIEPLYIPSGSTLIVDAAGALNNVAVSPIIDGVVVINAENTWNDDMDVRGSMRINATTTVKGDVTVRSTLTVNADLLADNLYLEANSVLTHTAGVFGMNIDVPGMFTVHLTSTVDADGKGLGGGRNGSGFGDLGETLDAGGGIAIAGSGLNNGGSHGSLGGQKNTATALAPIFDNPDDPQLPGGGGGAGDCTAFGGRGGGVVRIKAGITDIAGIISARGASQGGNCDGGGGGAGGTINLDFGLLQGTLGATIQADGGAGTGGGGGGGGLVLVSYSAMTFPGVIRAEGGLGTTPGAAGTAAAVLNLRAPEFLSAPPTVAALGLEMTYTPTAVGSEPITWTLPLGPPGASVDGNSGVLTWQPDTVGTGSFVLRATNPNGSTDQSFTMDVFEVPIITSTPGNQAWVGSGYTYDADNIPEATGTGPLQWSTSQAPALLGIDTVSGRMSWIPNAQGPFTICLVVSNPAGFDEQCFVITVAPGGEVPPGITSTPALSTNPGEAYAYDSDHTPEATGSTPITWSASLVPAGFNIDVATGEISWLPDTDGSEGICITATNTWGQDSQCFTVGIGINSGGLRVVSFPTLATLQGVPYAYDEDSTIKAVGPGPIAFEKLEGPADLAVGSATGLITWTPTNAGNVGVAVGISNRQTTIQHAFTVSVLPLAGTSPPIVIHSANPLAAIETSYLFDEDRHAEAGGSQPISWIKMSGPDAFNIDAVTGLVTWVPTTAGFETITIGASNDHGIDSYTFDVEVLETRGQGVRAVAVVSPLMGAAPHDIDVDGSQSYSSAHRIVSYVWNFGDGSDRIYEPDTSHTFERAGSYVVSLEVTDELGNTDVVQQVVVVSLSLAVPPSAQILVSRVEGRDALQVSFACDCTPGSSPITSYTWDFGNAELVDGLIATHIFGPGSHDVSLTVVDDAGLTARDRVAIQVSRGSKQPPLIFTAADPTSGAAPLTVNLRADHGDYDGSVESVSWDFGDGRTATGSSTDVTYDEPGVFSVTATATDDDGLTATSTIDIIVTTLLGETPPKILSQPGLQAEVGREYHYDPDGLPAALGTRPLTWKLGKEAGGARVGAPEGMEVGVDTGRVTWTPTEEGMVSVSLIATNAAGASLQEWEVEVLAGSGSTAATTGVSTKGGCGCISSSSHTPWLALIALPWLVLRRRRRGSAGPVRV